MWLAPMTKPGRAEVTMKAARLHRYRQPLVVEEVPTPRPGPGEVLVKAEGSGFCHSDTRFEVAFEATLWGTIKELREVVALAETGRLTPIPIELASLDEINEVYARLKRGTVRGRVVIRPAA
jgi:D-arabinose 1-dehydrogenase-like Zn-dependent alcohol dehydrogenase